MTASARLPCRVIEAFDEDTQQRTQLALFPAQREVPEHAKAYGVQVRLEAMQLHRPRQWGACWLACQVSEQRARKLMALALGPTVRPGVQVKLLPQQQELYAFGGKPRARPQGARHASAPAQGRLVKRPKQLQQMKVDDTPTSC